MRRATLEVVIVVLALGWISCSPALEGEEDWTLDAEAVEAPTEPLSGPVEELVDRIASDDPMDAAKAWNQLGAKYTSAKSYIADVGPAFWDTRPVRFEFVKERFSGGGHTFIYYEVKTPSSKGIPAYAHTVGQALVHRLWALEDVSNSGFKGSFRAWWAGYAPGHNLPPPK